MIKNIKTAVEVKEAYIKLCDAAITSIILDNNDEVTRVVNELKDSVFLSGDLLQFKKFMVDGNGWINAVNKAIEKRVDKNEATDPFNKMIEVANETWNEETGEFTAINVDEEEKAAIVANAFIEAEETLPDNATQEEISEYVDKQLDQQKVTVESLQKRLNTLTTKNDGEDTKTTSLFKSVILGAGAIAAVAGAVFVVAKAISAYRDASDGDIIIVEN